MKQWFENLPLKRKILSAVSIPLGLLLAVGMIAIVSLQFVSYNVRWVDHTHRAMSKSDAIVAAAVDMETGMRGFLLAGAENFLEPYNSGEARIFDALSELQTTVSDNPPQVQRLRDAEKIIRDWQQDVVQLQIGLRREIGDSDTMNDISRIVGEAQGKKYFDAFRAQVALFIQREEDLLAQRSETLRSSMAYGNASANDAVEAIDWVTHTYRVIGEAQRLLSAAIDMETGMRGYLLAGKIEFLEPYDAGGTSFDAIRASLAETVDDNPSQVQLLREIQATIDEWRAEIVTPMIDLRTRIGDAKTMDHMADLIREARGKTYFDAFRAKMADFRAEEADLLVVRSENLASATTLAFVLIVAFLILAVGSGVWIASKAGASIATPIRCVIDAMRAIIDGDSGVKIDGQNRKDEVGALAQAAFAFKENAEKVLKLAEADAESARKLEEAAKRSAQETAEAAKKEKEIQAEERHRQEQVTSLQSSIKDVVDSALEGDFSSRVHAEYAEQELVQLAKTINLMLENVEQGVAVTKGCLSRVAQGDLTERMTGDFKGSFQELQSNVNEMIDNLTQLIDEISGSTDNLSGSSSELRGTSDVLSKQAEQNAASLEETSAALEELSASIKQVDANIANASQNARVTSDTAKEGKAVASEAAAAMSRINEASSEISKVVSVINDISFQINLLALNAGVEAARAGEAGRGFSVVASEVRSLAQRASEASGEIAAVIAKSDDAVSQGVEKVSSAEASLEKITDSVIEVSGNIQEVAQAISEQVSGVADINSAVVQIDQNTQKQAASFEEVTAASALLSNEAEGLKHASSRFKTGSNIVRMSKRNSELTPATSPSASQPKLVANGISADQASVESWTEF